MSVDAEESKEKTMEEVPNDEEVSQNEEEEAKRKTEEEIAILRDYIEDVKKRNQWKSELRTKHAEAEKEENRPDESELRKLDSSLKKNTAFVRKLKNFTDAQKDAIKKEMSSLNLSKYIAEVVASIVEAKLKMSDLPAAIEICSFLHTKYADFSLHLLEAWKKALSLKKDEKVSNPSKLRVDLRFYAELVACRIFSQKQGLPLLGQVLTALVALDKDDHANASIILAFCKHCGDDYAGLVPRKINNLAAKHSYELPQSSFLPPEKQKSLRQLLKDYYVSLTKHLQSEYKEYQNVERTNRRILMTKGEVHTERKERAEALQASYTKLLTNTEQMSDLLDEDMPILEEPEKKAEDAELDDAEVDAQGEIEASTLGELWEDEETKCFYESLPELKAIIPGILYKDSSQQASLKEDTIQDENEEENEGEIEEELSAPIESVDGPEEEVAPPNIEDETEESEPQNASNKMLMDAFLSKLPTCIGREMIDNAAVEFCMNLNTKNNRKKLVKNLFSVHRNRQDLLPFYSRLVATLYPCMPEVAVDLSQYIKQEFRWLVRKKDQMKIESKLKICRYIGEMVKFKMFPKSEALFCMKMLLFDFSHHHIEMACTLMETCGRFLYRTPESHRRTKIYLEQMMRKKTAISMDTRYSMMIENAYFTVNPPEITVQAVPKLPPMEEYVHQLLYRDLNKITTEKVLKQIRKLDWNDKYTASFTINCLSSIWNVKYFNIRYVASLLAGLVSYHDWIGPRIVDNVLEDIRLQMEVNDPQHNQRRISVVRFLGELYNYRLIDSSIVFKVLYSLISFGVPVNPDDYSPLDPPEHMLRIRLICVILDTCGVYFNAGSNKKKLDYFLKYFQLYFWRKRACSLWKEVEEPKFPVMVINLVIDTISSLRPKMKLFSSYKEAQDATQRLQRDLLKTLQEKAPDLVTYLEPEASSGDKNAALGAITEEDEENMEVNEDDAEEEEENDDDDEDDDGSRAGSRLANNRNDDDCDNEDNSQDENEVVEENVNRKQKSSTLPKHIHCEEDDEFQQMFDKMLNENISEIRPSLPRSQQINIVAPVQVKNKKSQEQPPSSENTVQFTVLMRKGNKTSCREIAVSAEDEIARNLQKQELADRLEKERVKRLTLQINERQEEEDFEDTIAPLQRPLASANRKAHKTQQGQRGTPDADAIFGSKKSSNW